MCDGMHWVGRARLLPSRNYEVRTEVDVTGLKTRGTHWVRHIHHVPRIDLPPALLNGYDPCEDKP